MKKVFLIYFLLAASAFPQGARPPVTTLSGLSDVFITSPTSGQSLLWNSSTSKWNNGPVPVPLLSDLADVAVVSTADNQVLRWDSVSSKWVNYGPLAFSDITGSVSVSQMNGGAFASAASFWRGDGTWATVPTAGGPVPTTTNVLMGNGAGGATDSNATSPTLLMDTAGLHSQGANNGDFILDFWNQTAGTSATAGMQLKNSGGLAQLKLMGSSNTGTGIITADDLWIRNDIATTGNIVLSTNGNNVLFSNNGGTTEQVRIGNGISAGTNIDPGLGLINAKTGFQINNAAPVGHTLVGNGTSYVDSAAGGGSGTVTNFSAGDLSPLFTTAEATTTTTPALSFSLSTAAANTVFGNATASTAAPTFSSSPRFTAIGNLTTNGFVKTGGAVGTLSVDTATYLTANQNISLTGDVTGGPAATSIATTIGANKVTLGMMATMATDSILGRATAATGNVEVLAALPFAFTGDVTRPIDSNAQTIANSAVTYAKMQNVSANSKLLGSSDTGSGAPPSEITLGTNLSMSGTTLNATGGGGGTPGGSTTQVQYNNGGAFGGMSGVTWDNANGIATFNNVAGAVVAPFYSQLIIKGDATHDTGIGFESARSFTQRWLLGGGSGAPHNFFRLSDLNSGGDVISFRPTSHDIGIFPSANFGWSSATDASGTIDTALARNAAGVVEVNNGTAGSYRDIKVDEVDAVTGYKLNGTTINLDYSNTSVTSQSPSTSDVYLAGSNIVIPAGGFKAAGQYRCVFDVVKSAGTGTIVLTLRIGTLGTTGDTSRITFTFPAGTSVADTGNMEVIVNWRTVGGGTSAVVSGFCRAVKNTVTAAGLWNTTSPALTIVGAVSGGFDSSAATTVGLSFNGGTAFAGTITTVQANLFQK